MNRLAGVRLGGDRRKPVSVFVGSGGCATMAEWSHEQ
jgi:hypothetical protein